MANRHKRSSLLYWGIDPLQPTGSHAEEAYRLTADWRAWGIPILLAAFLLVPSVIGWILKPEEFYPAYLVGWSFCLSIALGALFFVMIQHLTRARWSVVVRRIAESLIWTFPALIVLSIPIFFGLHDLYHWTHSELFDPSAPEYDALVAGKQAYLNVGFFTLRVLFYFVIWTLVSYKLYTLSVRQDLDPDRTIPAQQRKVSAWGLLLTAVTTSFATYDLVMSVDPHWYSTIIGVYFFAGAFWAAHATIALVGISFRRTGLLKGIITKEHYQDLGKLLFGFTVFWAYIAFSQYMLIWYGNIPEETIWYMHRMEHGWEVHSAILLVAHFILPFIILLPRATKRSIPVLAVMCVWALVMQWFDLHWLVMPALRPDEAGIHWLDVTCWLGLTSLMAGLLIFRLSRHALIPQRDPYLPASIHFENV